ncbi:MAG TPA: hypothetical protein VFU21_08770 [Kofleriaceae bacterium]|nr:hypothetical protein [Kofleriaceae bacterium]
MRRAGLALALAACGRGDPPPAPPPPPVVASAPADAAARSPIDAGLAPPTLEDALARLRHAGLGQAADVIARRVAQRRPKMRLTAEEGRAAAAALLALADREPWRALHAVMPRSTVELARAVAERGLPAADAEEIARYLVRVVAACRFERLATFDDNHSHVTGRDWHEIDYSGEGMTWQGQKAYWQPRGVESFRKAEFIRAYFTAAERMEHWKRVYRPRGRL